MEKTTDHEYNIKVRLLDEIDRHLSHRHRFLQRLIPRFDLKELHDSYVLIGELPGVQAAKDLIITATDKHNLEISGSAKRGILEETAPGREHVDEEREPSSQNDKSLPKPTKKEFNGLSTSDEPIDPKDTVATKPKLLISERLLGEFHRSFSFTKPIEPKLVTASMQDGLLKVIVPMGSAPKLREIPVDYMGIAYAGF